MGISVSSSAFRNADRIPSRYTCDGEDVSPPLSWSEPPPGTQSFALIVDDPDAGGWTHWIAFNIPARARGLPEGVPADGRLADGTCQGTNDFGGIGYGGPCPPGGSHRYNFALYALSKPLTLEKGASQSEVIAAMRGCVLDQGTLVGLYR